VSQPPRCPCPSSPNSNYRACVRAHQAALATQRALWTALLHDTLTYDGLRAGFAAMQAAQVQAHQVYRRVLERYPRYAAWGHATWTRQP
jgi:hypothetical protein